MTSKIETSNLTTTEFPIGTTERPHDPQAIAKSIGILSVPFSIIAFFCILSGILYYVMKRRRLDQLRHHLVPMYTFDPGEGDDWETEVVESSLDPKIQKRQNDYQTMDVMNSGVS